MAKAKRKNSSKRFGKECSKRKKVAIYEEEEKVIAPYFDNEIMSNIMTKIQADLLHKKFRYQCKEWFNVVSHPDFKDTNLLTCKPGILFSDQHVEKKGVKVVGFMELDGLEIKTRELNAFPANLKVMSSCNGLVLTVCYRDSTIFILNPSTKESIEIPECKNHKSLWHDLVFVPSTKEYKVVDMFKDVKKGLTFHTRTLGGGRDDSYCSSDSLKKTWLPNSYNCIMADIFWNERISVDGILYVNIGSSTKVVSFDPCNNGSVRLLELPSFGPSEPDEQQKGVRLIELSGRLSVVNCVRDDEKYNPLSPNLPTDIWTLKDKNKGGWEKKFRIDAFPEHLHNVRFYWYKIIGSLNDGKEIIFTTRNEIYVYTVKSRQWKLIIVKPNRGSERFKCYSRLHVNSLISLK